MNSSPNLKGTVFRVGRYVLAAAVLCAVIYLVTTGDLVEALRQVSLFDVAILVGISFLLIAVSVVKWRLFLESLGINRSFKQLFGLYLVGYFVNTFTPSFIGGDVARSLALGPTVNRAHAVSATALERYTGIVAMLFMAGCAALVSSVVTKEIILIVVLAVCSCSIGTWLIFAGHVNKIAARLNLPKKVVATLDSVHQGLVLGTRDRNLVKRALVLSIVFHLLTIVNTAAVGAAVGWQEIPWGGLLVVVPLILLIGAVPISPQGLGIQEGAFVFFLHSVGASTGQALAIALILRAKSYLLALLGALVWIACRGELGVGAGTDN
jgi:uncharacterized protein (TIRG00374 family)